MEMLDEDLRKDVDGRQGVQRDGAVTGPHQVDPEHTGQVRRTHLVDEALLRHLRRTRQTLKHLFPDKVLLSGVSADVPCAGNTAGTL